VDTILKALVPINKVTSLVAYGFSFGESVYPRSYKNHPNGGLCAPARLSESSKGGQAMRLSSGIRDDSLLSNAEAMSVYHPFDGGITLCVQPIGDGAYCVYANAVIIAVHRDRPSADAHCQRLRNQQVDE
jgi:hypothetical protein